MTNDFKKVESKLFSYKTDIFRNVKEYNTDDQNAVFYTVNDVFNAFKKKNGDLSYSVFLSALKTQDWATVCVSKKNTMLSIVGDSEKVEMDVLKEIMYQIENGTFKTQGSEETPRKTRVETNEAKKQKMESVVFSNIKPVYNKIEDSNNVLAKNLKGISRKFEHEETDDFDTEDSYIGAYINKNSIKKESPEKGSVKLQSAIEREGTDTVSLSFDKLSERIVDSFGKFPIIPIQMLNAAMCKKFGTGFEWKTQSCNLYKHKHGNLKKFMLCCKKFCKVLTYKNVYLKCTTNNMKNITEKRKLQYLVSESNPKFKLFTETLIRNLFAIKCTLPLDDLCEIFSEVYGTKLDSLISDVSVKRFLSSLKSENLMVLYHSENQCSVTVVPFSEDEHFTEYKDTNIQEEIEQIEKKIDSVQVKEENGYVKNWCGLYALQEEFDDLFENGKINEVKAEILMKNCGKEMMLLIQRAELNIPKKIQMLNSNNVPEKFKYTPLWKYIVTNVNVDGKSAFMHYKL